MDSIADALAGIARALEADGYVMTLTHHLKHGGGVDVHIAATPQACADCLSPKGVLQDMIQAALSQAKLGDVPFAIFYPGVDDGQTEEAHLTATRYRLNDDFDAVEFCYAAGWTDGLPVVPPTPDRVSAMLTAARLEPDAVLGQIPERRITLRAEQVAINAVMAGCRPEYMPGVVAAVRALLDPAFGLHGPAASTQGVAFLTVINGPYARRIGLNAGENLFGPANRANATIGRAMRLSLLNTGAGLFDRATLGHPGKYTYCVAEQEEAGWEPLHVMRGHDPRSSTVTVLAAEAPNQVSNHVAATPEALLDSFARRMAAPGSSNAQSGNVEMAVVICPEHRRSLQAVGWSKRDVQQYLWLHALNSVADLKRAGVLEGPVAPADEVQLRHVTPAPEDILIITAGGDAGRFSAVIPGWGAKESSRAVTVPIR